MTAAHHLRTSDAGAPSQAANRDQQLYFVPGYRDGESPYGGFTVPRVRIAEEAMAGRGPGRRRAGDDPARHGRSISEVTAVERIGSHPDSIAASLCRRQQHGLSYQ